MSLFPCYCIIAFYWKHLFRLLYGEFKRQEGSGPPPLRVNGVSKRDRKGLDVAVDGWEDLAQEGKTLPRMGRPCLGSFPLEPGTKSHPAQRGRDATACVR